MTQPTKVAGTLRRAVRSSAINGILGGRHMECAYYYDFCRLCLVGAVGIGDPGGSGCSKVFWKYFKIVGMFSLEISH